MMTDEEKAKVATEYRSACHAMQSGVAVDQARGSGDGTPKHLRVGINSAMCDHAALVRLLLAKGILTEEEYALAIRDEMVREKERYEEMLGVKLI